MGEKMVRTQILLEREQHRALSEAARRQDRSVSHLIREIVEKYLVEQDEATQKRLESLEQIQRDWSRILESRGGKPLDIDTTALIEEMREERANELLANILRGR
jgi:hypothetical protein